MKFIKINPFDRTVTIVESDDSGKFLPFAYEQIGCSLVECHVIGQNATNGNSLDMWLDEEGAFKAEEPGRQAFFGTVSSHGFNVRNGIALIAESDKAGNTCGIIEAEAEQLREAVEKRVSFPPEELVEDVRQAVLDGLRAGPQIITIQ